MESRSININANSFILLLRKGDNRAFETLFRLYYDKLFHIAKGYLDSYEDAEGVVQNTFLKIWEYRSKLEVSTNLNGYLYAMTKNACLDHLKHQKIKNSYIDLRQHKKRMIQYQFLKDEAASLLLKNELERKIIQGLDLLPEKCKKVFVKSRMEGLKHHEIAKLMGISKRTVDNHIANALRHMRLHLREFLSLIFIILLK
ncbi:RNA polymerase sigma-70 factor [Flagellimonas flava]|uniref:RNA polymerase sigma-70 factor n=1 Tax=Flagellimonas flava TaxID=570519 RepID=UPI003D654561